MGTSAAHAITAMSASCHHPRAANQPSAYQNPICCTSSQTKNRLASPISWMPAL